MRLMETIFKEEIGDFVCIYIDDIFIYSITMGDYLRHMHVLCNKLKEVKLYANPQKCQFLAENWRY